MVFLPAYCPEINPIGRLWRDLKDELACEQFSDVASQQEAVAKLLRAYDAPTIQSLTGYAYLVDAIDALSS